MNYSIFKAFEEAKFVNTLFAKNNNKILTYKKKKLINKISLIRKLAKKNKAPIKTTKELIKFII